MLDFNFLEDTKSVLGIIAGIISFSAYLIYIISTLRGKTKPSRSTWWILTFIGILIFVSSYSIDARESMWIQLSYILGPLIIGILSLFPKYGYGSKLLPIDKICLSGAFLCIALWVIFNSPLIAFLGSIIVDFIGLFPTIKKAYFDPKGENPIAWSIEIIASIINALGISVWFSFASKDWIYALYLIISNGIILILLWRPFLGFKNLQIK